MNKNRSLYNILLGYLIKKGNKLKAKKILDESFAILSQKLNLPLPLILRRILKKMGTGIEVKIIKMRKNTHVVPFPVNTKRRNYVLVKQIMDAVKEDSSNRPYHIKLADELSSIFSDKSSKSLLKNRQTIKQAILNRSNLHYRW